MALMVAEIYNINHLFHFMLGGHYSFLLISNPASSAVTAHLHADPYLNTDAGTMSPIEHGEVYVLDDGGEVTAPTHRRLSASHCAKLHTVSFYEICSY